MNGQTQNAIRYTGTPGHVESWFLRANHPTRPLALWIKVTVLARLDGGPVAETWLVLFDGETGRSFAHRDTWPLSASDLLAALPGDSLRAGTFDLGLIISGGPARTGHATGTAGGARFELEWSPLGGDEGQDGGGALAGPLCIYPWKWLVTGPFPKSKLLTPCPWLRFRGTVSWPGVGGAGGDERAGAGDGGETWDISDWNGMQGHNWGKEHAWEYAWGQCVFDGAEPAMVEGFTGRIKLGGRLTPRMSAMVVRRGSQEYRFDRLFDPWRQEATVTPRRWTVRLKSADGEARLRMDAGDQPMVCLGYPNPDGRLSYCFNSKLASVLLEVRPKGGEPFTCRSDHGGALEFLRHEPEPALPVT